MPNDQPKLTPDQRERAKAILDRVREEVEREAGSDRTVAFAMRRYIYVRLSHDERKKPNQRRALKMRKFDQQQGICTMCKEPLVQIGHTHLHRRDQLAGYTVENTDLVHADCHRKQQADRNYA
jgi:hypothetical protein